MSPKAVSPKCDLPTCRKENWFCLHLSILWFFFGECFRSPCQFISCGKSQVPPTCTQMQFLEKMQILIFHFCHVSSNSIVAIFPYCSVCSEDFSQFTFCSGRQRGHPRLQPMCFLNLCPSPGYTID